MSDTGGPAFPVVVPIDNDGVEDGMTLRDYFAAKAMAGMCVEWDGGFCEPTLVESDFIKDPKGEYIRSMYGSYRQLSLSATTSAERYTLITSRFQRIARDAYSIADAMLEARAKPSN